MATLPQHPFESSAESGEGANGELGDRPNSARRMRDDYCDVERSFSLRAVVSGLLIGLLINVSNTYYGLRVGAGNSMSMVSGLLGYAGFKATSKYLSTQLDPAENVLVVSVATAMGCMPLTAGLIGAIPALEFCIGPDENGPLHVDLVPLLSWSLGLSFFGIIFVVLLREHFIERSRLPWPGPTATAHLIRTLHHNAPLPLPVSSETSLERPSSPSEEFNPQLGPEPHFSHAQGSEIDWKIASNSLMRGAIASGLICAVMMFFPILHELPVFGREAASTWFWTLDLSPGFLGQGMIIGPSISLHMLLGAIVGWGFLSPYAKYRGWAPGDVDDWTTGSRGWIIWVSLASLLADASVKMTWLVLQPVWRDYLVNGHLRDLLIGLWSKNVRHHRQRSSQIQYVPVPAEDFPHQLRARHNIVLGKRPFNWDFLSIGISTGPVLGIGFLVSLVFCTLTVHFAFGDFIPWSFTPLAIALSLPMATVGVRSIAETDYNPESAILSQLVFASLVSHSNPNATIINVISAAIAVAAANQAGDLAYDLKVGSLIGARPGAQFLGQIIGSIFGALVSCGIYRLYASQYEIPGALFRVPSAYLILSTARLILGRGLPEGVWPFVLGAALLSAFSSIVRARYEDKWWQKLIPSGVSFAIGIYLLPSFSISRALGGLVYWGYTHHTRRQGNIMIFASGLVLGESFAGLVNVGFTALDAAVLRPNQSLR